MIAQTHSLRCDAKQADDEVRGLLRQIVAQDYFFLGELLPRPFVKGIQHKYLDEPTDDSVPVINTISIQNLCLNTQVCRHITCEEFDCLSTERQVRRNDVLVTVDGGVSIGKSYLIDLRGRFTVDSHVAILRPEGIEPLSLVYLLACPVGQAQFRLAESGASGQTTVTEDDIRRFVFPRRVLESIDEQCHVAEAERQQILEQRKELAKREKAIWDGITIL